MINKPWQGEEVNRESQGTQGTSSSENRKYMESQ
jgi:hypothetical protein